MLADIYFGILVAFVIEVFLGKDRCTVHHILRQTHTLGHAQLVLQILALRLLHAEIVDSGNTWP